MFIKHLLLSITLVTSAPAIALACGNAMYVDGDDAVQQLVRAEKMLAQGKNNKAEHLVGFRYRFGPNQKHKAMVIRASAAFRMYKASDYHVQQGITALNRALKDHKDNPLLLARLAEGYALSAETSGQAKKILEDLATRDLMPDGFAFATLSTLRSQAGETEGAAVAMKSCREMISKKRLCSKKKTQIKSPPTPRSRSKSKKRG